MKKKLSCLSAIALLLAYGHSKAADEVVVWKTTLGNGNFVTPNTLFRLYCITNQSYLDYYRRNRGINLAFNQGLSVSNIKFVRSGTATEAIKYGEKIAIYVAGGGYLYYTRRTYGINLSYSSRPVYEWELRNASYLQTGAPNTEAIRARDLFSLYNAHNQGYMVYGERTWGPNLTWATTGSPNATAEAEVSFRTGPYPFSPTSSGCTGSLTWSFTPVALTGSSGKDAPFTENRSYQTTATGTGNEWWCVFSGKLSGIKAGEWKIKVQSPVWVTECQIRLVNGANLINFTERRQGCGTGTRFP